MLKAIRWLLVLAAVVVALPLASKWLVLWWVNTEPVKAAFIQELHAKTGMQLGINGAVSIDFDFPPQLILSDVSLVSPAGFGSAELMHADEVSVLFDPWPLLDHFIKIEQIHLQHPIINLERSADGRTSWPTQAELAAIDLAPWKLEPPRALILDQAVLGWDDQQAQLHFAFENANLKIGMPAWLDNIPLRAEFPLQLGDYQAEVRLETDISIPQDLSIIHAYGLAIAMEISGGLIAEPGLQLLMAADAGMQLERGEAALEDLSIAFGDVDITGNLTWTDLYATPLASGEISLVAGDLASQFKRFGIDYQPTSEGDQGRLALRAEVDVDGNLLKLNTIKGNMDNSKLQGDLSLRLKTTPDLAFNFALDQLDADRFRLGHERNLAFNAKGQLEIEALNSQGVRTNNQGFSVHTRQGTWVVDRSYELAPGSFSATK